MNLPSKAYEPNRKGALRRVVGRLRRSALRFVDSHVLRSRRYWEQRYAKGGNSGAGSYGRLASFKAEVLNDFVTKYGVTRVVEFGCGDGNQLSLAAYPNYVGVDVSETALALCHQKYQHDKSKTFCQKLPDDTKGFDLSLSLDVIYHLLEDDAFDNYMSNMIAASGAWIVIYSSNIDDKSFAHQHGIRPEPHVKHRRFSDWMAQNAANWVLDHMVKNIYPFDPTNPENTSFSDFYFYRKS